MKVLITGAGGYVGKILVQFLVNQKYEIYALYNRQLPDYMASIPEVNWIQSKLGFNIIDLDPVDVIIHAATAQPLSTPPPPIRAPLANPILFKTRSGAIFNNAFLKFMLIPF